ncbi:hypothetical protein Agub_g5887, partial [Astrephomene gubernaculifera]
GYYGGHVTLLCSSYVQGCAEAAEPRLFVFLGRRSLGEMSKLSGILYILVLSCAFAIWPINGTEVCNVCVELYDIQGDLGVGGKQCSALAARLTGFYTDDADMPFGLLTKFECVDQSPVRLLACATAGEADVSLLADYFWQTGTIFDFYIGDRFDFKPIACKDVGRVPDKNITIRSPCVP